MIKINETKKKQKKYEKYLREKNKRRNFAPEINKQPFKTEEATDRQTATKDNESK